MTSRPQLLVVQHDDECPSAWFGTWLCEAGCELDVRRPYLGQSLPADLTGHDGLLVLGGPMGANDDAQFGWLTRTKELIREAAADGVPTLGICLGHQLAAVALGGSVVVNPRGQQLGVLDIGWTATADDLLASRPATGIQWNNDIVDRVPDGTVVLARTGAGELQAARFAPQLWGVQLHPEADTAVLKPWADHDRAIQGAGTIDAALAKVEEALPGLMAAWRPVAVRFATLVGAASSA